jgi:hypothetical protein
VYRQYLFLLLLFALSPVVQATDSEMLERMQVDWTRLLATFVDEEGRTDFRTLATEPEPLKALVDFIESTSPSSHPGLFPTREDVLAYHINAYNILAMYGVIDEGIPKDFNGFFKRAGFFKFRSVIIGGDKTSLYDYENKVIRPLDEPRVHFVLNCMVRDCPRLPQQAFLSGTLETQLEAATQEFFSKEKHFRLDAGKKTVYLSSILDFYTEDFVTSGKAKDLASYVNRYRRVPVPAGYKVKFIKYDWTINQSPGPQ